MSCIVERAMHLESEEWWAILHGGKELRPRSQGAWV